MRANCFLIAGSILLLVTTSQAEIQRWRVGDQGHPWNLSPVSGRLSWGRGWSVEIVTDDDGDGAVDEDGVELLDNDGDSLVNEDPTDGFDNDRDGQIDEDGPDPQVDNDGDGRLNEDGRHTNGDDDRDGKFNEDLLDGADNDGDGLIDEDGPRLADDPAKGLTTWLQPIHLDSTRNLATLVNERYLDGEFGGVTAEKTLLNPSMVVPSIFGYRNEPADPISADQWSVASVTGRVDFGLMLDNKLSTAFGARGDGLGGIDMILQGYYYVNRITIRPRPTLPGAALSYYRIAYGDSSTLDRTTQFIQGWKTLWPRQIDNDGDGQINEDWIDGRDNDIDRKIDEDPAETVSGEFVPSVKNFTFDPPVLMGRLDINSTAAYGIYVETAEVGVFGEGFPTDASFTSEIIDVGTPTPRFRRYAQQMELYAESDSAKLSTQFPDRSGKLVNWGKARWKGRRLGPGEEGKVRIQFRAGNTLDTHVYARRLGPGLSDERDDKGLPLTAFKWSKLTDGRIEEISLQYNEIGQQLGADGAQGWSYWSAPFSFEEGLIDTTLPPEQWTSAGVPLPLPGGSRYLQFRLLFDSSIQSAVSLDYLEFDYDVPLASGGVLAEIFPAQVPLGENTTFHYFLRPVFAEADGASFNRIEIQVPDLATRIDTLRFDGQVWQQIDPAQGDDPLALAQPRRLPPTAGRADSLGQFAQSILPDPATGGGRLLVKLPPMSSRHFRLGESLEIVFTSKLFRGAKQFTSSVWNDQLGTQATIIPQPTKPGDATAEVATNDVNVVVEKIDQPLSPIRLATRIFTPNGDGVNDLLQLSFDLFLLLEQTQVQVDILDLSGRQVAVVGPLSQTAGTAQLTWDGKDAEGKRVPPGIYLYRLKVGGASATTEQTGTLSVVY